jgi:hypothetical protein
LQFLPDSVLLATPMGRIKNCHLPAMALTVVLVLAVCQLVSFSVPLMVMVGESAGWLYLRFYQRHSNGTKGDMSDHFTWARSVSLRRGDTQFTHHLCFAFFNSACRSITDWG